MNSDILELGDDSACPLTPELPPIHLPDIGADDDADGMNVVVRSGDGEELSEGLLWCA